jgi:hypothetical protein
VPGDKVGRRMASTGAGFDPRDALTSVRLGVFLNFDFFFPRNPRWVGGDRRLV